MSRRVNTKPGIAASQRIARAQQLAAATPAAASLLTFYARVAAEQLRLCVTYPTRKVLSNDARVLGTAIDRDAVVAALLDLLVWLPAAAPETLAQAATALSSRTAGEWRRRLDALIDGLPASVDEGCDGFVMEAALQPFAEAGAAPRIDWDTGVRSGNSMHCPFCGDRPAVAVFREAGHGARRSFVCGLCLTDWPAPRLGCVSCGETAFDRLPAFRADEITAARVDACETCRIYLKTIDLTRDGHAVPVVDDLATVSLDLWAREQGYRRLRPHLLRV